MVEVSSGITIDVASSNNSDRTRAIAVMMETMVNRDMHMDSNEVDRPGGPQAAGGPVEAAVAAAAGVLVAVAATTPLVGQFRVFSGGRKGRPSCSTRSTSTSVRRSEPQHHR